MTPNIAERVASIKSKAEIWVDLTGITQETCEIPEKDFDFLLDLIGKYQKIIKTVDDFIAPVPRGFSPRFEWEEIKKESGLFGEGK